MEGAKINSKMIHLLKIGLYNQSLSIGQPAKQPGSLFPPGHSTLAHTIISCREYPLVSYQFLPATIGSLPSLQPTHAVVVTLSMIGTAF